MMDNKEAIETLKSNYPSSNYSMLCEAVDAAIAALEINIIHCKDCIHAPLPGKAKGGFDLKWPKINGVYEDCTCPYYCDDEWYSIRPDPNGFCNKGETKND